MKNILLSMIFTLLMSFIFNANADTFLNKCSYYVHSTAIEKSGYYRFQLRDTHDVLYPKSNSWSFSAKDPRIIELLNIAHISHSLICISYSSYKDYWEIFHVSMEKE
ncbi:hypothetical protein GCM10009131_15480 [Morganella psychrotolerans]